jgi:thiol-disulfide isomerase/thioredoxin
MLACLCATAHADPDALLATVKNARGPAVESDLAKAFDELLAKHPDSPQLAAACERMLFVPPSRAIPRLRPVVAAKVSHRAAALARFVLARQVLDHLNNTPPPSRDAAIADAKRLLTEVVSRYGDERLGPRPVKAHAERALYEIEHLMPGKQAPEIVGEDLDLKPLKLSQFKGKVVLLSFWGAWCPPCVAALPEEKRVAERFATKPFVILGVNTDRDRAVASRVVSARSVTWRSFWDRSQVGPISTAYNVTGFPMLYLIDARGVIRHRDVPPDEESLAAHIESMLAGD